MTNTSILRQNARKKTILAPQKNEEELKGKCPICGVRFKDHPKCDACGILVGSWHLVGGLSKYEGKMLCGECRRVACQHHLTGEAFAMYCGGKDLLEIATLLRERERKSARLRDIERYIGKEV